MAIRGLLGKISLAGVLAPEAARVPRFAAVTDSLRSRLAANVGVIESKMGVSVGTIAAAAAAKLTPNRLHASQVLKDAAAGSVRTTSASRACPGSNLSTSTKFSAGATIGLSWVAKASAATRISGGRIKPVIPVYPCAVRHLCRIPAAGYGSKRWWPSGGKILGLLITACGLPLVWFQPSDQPVKIPNSCKPNVTDTDLEGDDLPDHFDWEEKGMLTPPALAFYNMISGCCFAIIAIHSVESAFTIETGEVVQLSVQQLLDCGTQQDGGLLHIAFNDIKNFGGLTTEGQYPFEFLQENRECQMEGKTIAVRIEGYKPIRNTERAFMRALLNQPIAVGVHANTAFDDHAGDSILDIEACPPGPDIVVPPGPNGELTAFSDINHAVLVVGWGTDKITGQKYWRVKNTYGPRWGKGGYGRLERGGPDWRGVAGITSHWGYQVKLKRD